MKVLFVLIFLSISIKGISQDIPEFKIEKNDSSSPRALNLKEIKEQIVYPDSAKINRIEGSVEARLLIDKNGDVKKILEIKGHLVFYNVIKEACLKLKFSPVYQNNKPTEFFIVVPFKFSLPEKIDTTRIDSNKYNESPKKIKFSLLDVNQNLVVWTTFIFLLPFLIIALVLYYMKKRKQK